MFGIIDDFILPLANQTRPGHNSRMSFYNITEAKAQLSALIEKVLKEGEEVIIQRAGKPVARLTRYEIAKTPRRLGVFQGQIQIADDFDVWPDDMATLLGMDE